MMIIVRKYLVVVLWNTNPVSRHLQCEITLYSKYKNETRIPNELEQMARDLCCVVVVIIIIIVSIIIIIIFIIKSN